MLQFPVRLLQRVGFYQRPPGPGVCPGGAVAPANFFYPAPGGAAAPAKDLDTAPGGAAAPAKCSDPAPGGAAAPASLPDPAPGGARPRPPRRYNQNGLYKKKRPEHISMILINL